MLSFNKLYIYYHKKNKLYFYIKVNLIFYYFCTRILLIFKYYAEKTYHTYPVFKDLLKIIRLVEL